MLIICYKVLLKFLSRVVICRDLANNRCTYCQKEFQEKSVHLGFSRQQKCNRLVRVASRLPISYLLRLILANTFFVNPCDVFKHMSVFCMWK